MSFIEKFFGYHRVLNGELEPFSDGLGKGQMDIRHLIWIVVAIILLIVLLKLSKKYPKQMIKITKGVLTFIFIQRFINQLIRTLIAAEVPFWRATFPIHLCSIMIFLLPLTVIFNWKKIKKPVYYLSMLGGFITMLDGDYFDSLFMTFSTIEGIVAHTVIFLAPAVMLKVEKQKFTLKDVRDTFIGIALVAIWSTIFNVILSIIKRGSNYLFLVNNMLPIGGKLFVLLYLLVFAILLLGFYLVYNKGNMKEVKEDIKKNKKKIIIFTICYLVCAVIVALINVACRL